MTIYRTNISIAGLGVVSAVGNGVDALRSAVRGEREPTIEVRAFETPNGVVRMPIYPASEEGVERFVSRRALRRMEPFSRKGILAAGLALEDAGIDSVDRQRTGIVFGSGHGPLGSTFAFQDGLIDDGDKCASPTHFANSVHNTLSSRTSMAFGIEGPAAAITTFGQTLAGVLTTAAIWLEEERADLVLAGVGEEYAPLLGYSTAALGRESDAPLAPERMHRCTYAPGEGFVVFALTKEPAASKYGRLREVQLGRAQADAAELGEAARGVDHLFVAARGDQREASSLERLISETPPRFGHSPLFGSMSTGDGFELAVACLSLSEGCVHRCGGVDEGEGPKQIPASARIGCLSCEGGDSACLVVLESPSD